MICITEFGVRLAKLLSREIEPGETPAQALIREVWEETGLKVKPLGISGVFSGKSGMLPKSGFRYTYPNGDRVEYLAVMFQRQIVEREMQRRIVSPKSF